MKTKPYSRFRASAGEDQDPDASPPKVTGGSGVRYVGRRQGFAPYQKYKPSGVEWPSRVPGHWTVKRLKYVARKTIENGINEAGIHDDPVWPRYIRITDIKTPRSLRYDTFRSLPPEKAAQAFVDPYDILLARVGTPGISYLHVPDDGTTQTCFAGYLVRYSPDAKHVAPGYVAYWTESHVYWACVRSRVIQTTIQNFSATRYKNLPMPLPPLMEQKTIELYLDQETAKIDALIAKNDVLIERLKEQRAALISRTVTRGLPPDESRKAGIDPHPKLKPSGVEFIGDVPEYWERFRLKYLAVLTMGQSPPSGAVQTDPVGFPFLQGCAEFGSDYPSADRYCCSPPKVAQKQTILLSVRAPVGEINVADKEYGIGRGLCAVQPNPRWYDRFAYWQLHVLARRDLKKVATGSTYGAVSVDNVADLNLMIPPYAEQRAIATFLDWVTAKIDGLVEKNQVLIDRLREKRQALITAAVTGQIDVRNASVDEAT